MKNKKGFTLSVVIGIIVVLGIIALISVPIINGMIKSSRQKTYDIQIKEIEKAARVWFTDNISKSEDPSILVWMKDLLSGD